MENVYYDNELMECFVDPISINIHKNVSLISLRKIEKCKDNLKYTHFFFFLCFISTSIVISVL